jgi:hypothetical protein
MQNDVPRENCRVKVKSFELTADGGKSSRLTSGRKNPDRRGFLKQAAGLAAGAAFGRPMIASAAETSGAGKTPVTRSGPAVVAIYCPLWHRYDYMEAWKGYGWTEWELLKTAPPRFAGHYQPLKPTWGYFDETDPAWASREIDMAADHNVDVFLIDWYWYSGVRLMEEGLEKGFLKAPNRERLKFALMWVNADWLDIFPAPYDKPYNIWLPMRHSHEDFLRIMDYSIERYFRQPNYWRVEDRLFYCIYVPEDFVKNMGGVEKTKSLFAAVDKKLHEAKLPPMHWNAMTADPSMVGQLQDAGFHSTTRYNIQCTGKTSANLTEEYEDLIPAHADFWKSMRETPLPHCPVVTVGWDATPRCEYTVPFPFARNRYPYMHVILDNTPERFERLCRLAAEAVAADPKHPPAVFINAWNEWTEGCFLLPEARYGTGYLEAVKRVFSR